MRALGAGMFAALLCIAVPTTAATTFLFQFDNAGLFINPDGTIARR